MSCANCGSATPPQATQCPECGLPLTTQPPPAWGVAAAGPTPASSWDAPPPGDPWAPSSGGPAGAAWGPPEGGSRSGGGDAGGPAGAAPPWGGQPYQPYPSGWNDPPTGSADRLAGWWRRVGATVLDGLIVLVPARIVDAGAGRASYYVFFFIVTAVYTTVLIAVRGQTVGMMAVGTRCVREGTASTLSYGAALGRWAMTEVLNLTVIGGVLDVLWPLWDANNQTLHDKVVHSVVVRVR